MGVCLAVCGYCSLVFLGGVGGSGMDVFALDRLAGLGIGARGTCLIIGALDECGVGDGAVSFTLGAVC